MKTVLQLMITFSLGWILLACTSSNEPVAHQGQAKEKIVLGAWGSDAEIWKHIAHSPQTRDLGVNIEVREINDGIALNQALLDRQIDVNAFQSWAYFKEFNQLHNQQLAALATTYLEPMGLYSLRFKSVEQLPVKAVVAIPNDVANTSRALRLLEKAGLIQLKPGFNTISGTVKDVVANPKQLQFKQIKGVQGPRVLGEVDLVAIGNTTALESGLNVLQDSIFREAVQDKTVENINILAVHGSQLNHPQLQKLGQLYHQPFVANYIKQHYGGTKLDIDLPVSELH